MGAQLPIFSFLSTLLLFLILPAQVHHYSIPSASIIVWLIFCNIIHGVNSVLWFGNQADHAPVWCDISRVFDQGLKQHINVLYSFRRAPWCYSGNSSLFLMHRSPT
jgi:hypothetical protein